MEKAIARLKKISRQHLTERKILVMPSVAAGQRFLQLATAEGLNCLNLRVETVERLAEEVAASSGEQGNPTMITKQVARLLLWQIITALQGEKRLSYFSRPEMTGGVIAALSSSLYQLRLAGYNAAALAAEHFISREKGQDIIELMKEYEKVLHRNNYLDEAELYHNAILLLGEQVSKGESLYIIPADLPVVYLSREFLNRLTTVSLKYILPALTVAGLEQPRRVYAPASAQIGSKTSSLAYLFDPANCPADLNKPAVLLSKAYGESNEVRAVLHQIKSKGLSLDHTAVFYSTVQPYAQLFYGLARYYDLPITFGDGISISNTAPGQLYFSLLEWIETDYREPVLRNLLTSGITKLAGDQAQTIATVLRQSGIGRGRERYLTVLNHQLGKKGRQQLDLVTPLQLTSDLVAGLFKLLPEADQQGMVAGGSFVSGLRKIVNDYCRLKGELEVEACNLIGEELAAIAVHLGVIRQEQLLSLLRGLFKESRVGASLPRPGFLHVSSFQQAGYIRRENTFIIGLDSDRFPGRGTADPVLLEGERKQLGRLSLKTERSRDEVSQLAGILAALRGSLYFSFSCYDLLEERELQPSSLLLQVYRLVQRDPTLGYADLLNSLPAAAGFIPAAEAALLDDNQYWLYYFGHNQESNRAIDLTSLYPDTARGELALAHRLQGRFNQYNGKIEVAPEVLDPRRNKQVFSASRLEMLAACPYKYFLQFILGIKAPLELEYNPACWLDPLTRGALLHRIFELFYRELTARKERPSLTGHINRLYALVEELLAEQRREVPPPSEIVFERERAEILQSCRVFLASEAANRRVAVPAYFELTFGLERGIALELAEGEQIWLSGRIDRVDRRAEGIFDIIDYKTGSTYGYKQSEYFKQGRQLQHALYALALEKILEQPVSVELAGYLFPALAGEGQYFLKPAVTKNASREDVRAIVRILLDLLASGTMLMTAQSADCQYCAYQVICQPDEQELLSRKQCRNSDDQPLVALRGLEQFV